MKKLVWISAVLLVVLGSCEEDNLATGECKSIIILEEQGAVISDPYMITSVQLDGSCLEIEVSTGGCNSDTWNARLFASPLVMESLPPQVSIELSLDSDELCKAAIKRTFSFNLDALNHIHDQMILHLSGWEEPIYYQVDPIISGQWNLVNINGGLTGLNADFDKGEITWDFGDETVTITNAYVGDDYSGFESGVYNYSLDVIDVLPHLIIDEVNIGGIYRSDSDTLIVDYRAADGFQYVLIK